MAQGAGRGAGRGAWRRACGRGREGVAESVKIGQKCAAEKAKLGECRKSAKIGPKNDAIFGKNSIVERIAIAALRA